MAYVVKKDH